MATILVAEDEDSIRKLMEMILVSAGYRVLTAANGVEEVALYRSYTTQIDLVITDLNMPVLDGYQAVLLIHETKPDAKIICMTGYAGQPVPDCTKFLAKPFTPPELVQCVAESLRGGS